MPKCVLGYSEITLLSNKKNKKRGLDEVLGYSEITLLSNLGPDSSDWSQSFRLL